MKKKSNKSKIVILLILAAAVAAGWYFYDPYLKPHVDSLIAKYGESDTPDGGAPAGPGGAKPSTPSKGGATKPPAPGPKPVVGTVTTPTTPPKPKPEAAPLSEIDRLLQAKYPLPDVIPLMTIVNNWNNVPQNAYPTEVALKEKASFTIPGVGSSVAAPGTMVRPTYLSGDTLTIASLANLAMRTKVPVDGTDFKDRIQDRYNAFVISSTAKVKEQRAKARKVLESRPEAMVAAKSTAWDSADDPRFGPVKRSLERGEISSVKAEEATAFRWAGNQNIRGDKIKGTHETVVVSFEVRTIFGVFPTEWMAVLNNGNVLGWVDPITHESP